MEFIFELLFELVLDGTIELSKSVKVPLPIRIILTILIALFYLAFIGLILLIGISTYKDNQIGGIIIILIDILIMIICVKAFVKIYLKRQDVNRS